jgi:hypothetical protein
MGAFSPLPTVLVHEQLSAYVQTHDPPVRFVFHVLTALDPVAMYPFQFNASQPVS